MTLSLKKINTTKRGVLYKLLHNNKEVTISLQNVKSLFKPDKYKNIHYIKWGISDDIKNILEIDAYETLFTETFEGKNITSNIITRDNYPLMINTKFTYTKTNPIIIDNSLISVPEHIENNLNKMYNITLKIGKIFINETHIKYPLHLVKIELVR